MNLYEHIAANGGVTAPVEEASTSSGLVDSMRVLLADVVTFSYMLQGAHWNVVGRSFHQDHTFFQMLYEDIEGSIDPLAENIRKAGGLAPSGLSDFQALRTIEDGPRSGDGTVFMSALLEANTVLIRSLTTLFEVADGENQQGIADFAAGRVDMHQKWDWQLRAHLGMI